jgi:hypothetical protein
MSNAVLLIRASSLPLPSTPILPILLARLMHHLEQGLEAFHGIIGLIDLHKENEEEMCTLNFLEV